MSTNAPAVSDEMMSEIMSMGFDVDVVQAALNHFNCDISQVITELVQRAGNIPDDWYHGVTSTDRPSTAGTTSNTTATSSTTATSTTSTTTNSSSDSGSYCCFTAIMSSSLTLTPARDDPLTVLVLN